MNQFMDELIIKSDLLKPFVDKVYTFSIKHSHKDLKSFCETAFNPDFWESIKEGEELYPAYREYGLRNSTNTKFRFYN